VTEPDGDAAVEEGASAQQVTRSYDRTAAAERYGVAQARALLHMFREETGRDAKTADELAEWIIRRIR
jgi:hypothetical protein